MFVSTKSWRYYIKMKGTEVPNPQRSSAGDCTCVLTRNRSLSRDSLMRIVLFLPIGQTTNLNAVTFINKSSPAK